MVLPNRWVVSTTIEPPGHLWFERPLRGDYGDVVSSTLASFAASSSQAIEVFALETLITRLAEVIEAGKYLFATFMKLQ